MSRTDLTQNVWTEISDSAKNIHNPNDFSILVQMSATQPTDQEGVILNPKNLQTFVPETGESIWGFTINEGQTVEDFNPNVMLAWNGTKYLPCKCDENGKMETTATLIVGDIEIGAVELKNEDTDERANIKDADTARTTGTKVLAVQNVDAEGKVISAQDLTDIKTAVEIVDDIVESSRAKTNPIVGQAGVDGNTGDATAKTQRVVTANDSPEVTNQTDGSQKSQVVDGAGNVISATSNALDVHLKSQEAGGIEVIQDTASDLNMTEANSGDIKTNQTDGSQKTQLVDGSGNVVGSTGNAVDVNLKTDNVGGIEVVQSASANLKMTEVNSGDIKTNTGNIEDNQTDGSQKSQIVDGAGDVIGSTGNALDILSEAQEVSSVPTAIAVTDTAQNVVLTKAEILNDGDNTIFFRDSTAPADTDDYPLHPDERIFLKGTISVICDTGLTSTLRILEVA